MSKFFKGLFFKVKNFDLHLNPIKVFQNAYYWFIAPLAIIFIALVCGTVYATAGNTGFANVGIEFRGGTVVSVEMIGADMINVNYNANVALITETVESHGVVISTVQTSGTNAIIVRYPNVVNNEDLNSSTARMNDVNNDITNALESKFKEVYGNNINISADAEQISATAKNELINKSILSICISMLLIGIYIIIRFDLFSGLAAVVGVIHDIIIMTAFVIIFKVQIGTTFIAGIITLVGYSINNTIIVFDRVRDSVKFYKIKKTKYDVKAIIDTSVSETLTRSLYTVFTTLIMLVALSLTGVPALVEFALPLTIGVIGGFYSSVFVVPAVWGLIMQAKFDGENKKKSNKYKERSKQKAGARG